MRKILFFSVLTGLLSCAPKNEASESSRWLTEEFAESENFFFLETLDLSKKGIKDRIHVIYVPFDPDTDEEAFSGNDNIDNFSFKIESNGKYHPLFNKSALIVGEDFREYFLEDLSVYRKALSENKISQWIDLTDKPEWWQYDETPLNSRGKPMQFICQVDMGRIIVNDDCRLFVFYDETDRIVKYIYQRD